MTAVFSTAVFLFIMGIAALVALRAAWIPLKAELAQWLLRDAWQQILAGNEQAKPWPWADTRPVAILRVPHLHIEQFVLEGNSGRNLAFGPVIQNSMAAGTDLVLSGHRDTHFRFLERLRTGDLISMETPRGMEEYVVDRAEIVDSSKNELVLEPARRRLSLVTCYPFDAPRAGGPLRYVVTAGPGDESKVRKNPPTSTSG